MRTDAIILTVVLLVLLSASRCRSAMWFGASTGVVTNHPLYLPIDRDYGSSGSFHVEVTETNGFRLQSRPARPEQGIRLRITSATPNTNDYGSQHFMVYPYDWGTAVELSGTNSMGQRTGGQIEFFVNQLSIQAVQGSGLPGRLQIGNEDDQAGLIFESMGPWEGNCADIAYRPYGVAGCYGDIQLRVSPTNVVKIVCGGDEFGPPKTLVTFDAMGNATFSGSITATGLHITGTNTP